MIQLKWVRSPIIFRAMHLDSFRKFRWVKEERIEKKTRGEMNLYRQIVCTMIQLKWVRSPIILRAMHLDSFRKFRLVKEERIEKKMRGEMNL